MYIFRKLRRTERVRKMDAVYVLRTYRKNINRTTERDAIPACMAGGSVT